MCSNATLHNAIHDTMSLGSTRSRLQVSKLPRTEFNALRGWFVRILQQDRSIKYFRTIIIILVCESREQIFLKLPFVSPELLWLCCYIIWFLKWWKLVTDETL